MTSDTVIGIDWERFQKIAPRVARKTAHDFPGVDAEDIEQEIYLHIAENPSVYKRGAGHSDEQVAGIMKGPARKYAGKERYAFIHFSAEWIYTPKEVRALFEEAFFTTDLWSQMPQKDDGVTINAKNVVVCLWDLSNAFDSLTPDEQAIVSKRYEYGEELTVNERKELQRAIDKVTMRLNGRMAAKNNEN